jgi:hypothetical protein
MFKDEAMKSDICKKAYVAPKMTVVECRGPNLLSGSEVIDMDSEDIKDCDCEFQ